VHGSFTGAIKDRIGRFELADGETLFLDEVGEISLEHQAKLLRVLQEGTFERIGEARTRHTDVRVIAATNRDLTKEVERGRFRADLYDRLGVFPIEVPPLRERREDLPALAQHFIARSAPAPAVAPDAPMPTLAEFRRRERALLESALERAAGKVSGPGGAAELLGVKPTTLASKLQAFGLRSSRRTDPARRWRG
jgi:transcriptional regulator with GAF, ATPase, and Fis domain